MSPALAGEFLTTAPPGKYLYYIFFNHSSFNGHLGFFPVLAIVKSAAMNIGGMYLFELEFCLDICPGVGLLDHMVIRFLVF